MPSPELEIGIVIDNHVGFWTANIVGIGAIIGTFFGWLPAVAAGIAAIFYIIQIWESATVRHYLANRKMVRKAKKIAKLRAREKIITAQLAALETVRQAKAIAKETVAVAQAEAAQQVVVESIEAETKTG